MSSAIMTLQNFLDHEAVRALLYSATAGLGITAAVMLAKAPDATNREQRIAWSSLAFDVLLALMAVALLIRWIANSNARATVTGGWNRFVRPTLGY